MRLRLKTKITLTISLLVLMVVGVTSWLHVLTLTRQVIEQADGRANIVAHDGTALISSDASLPGRKVLPRPPLSQLVGAGFIQQLRLIYGAPQAYDVSDPFKLGPPGRQMPFGEIRVALHTGLLAIEITPALRSAVYLALISVLV